jgi:hypothetical protein
VARHPEPFPGAGRMRFKAFYRPQGKALTSAFSQWRQRLTGEVSRPSHHNFRADEGQSRTVHVGHAKALQHMACIGQSSQRPATDLTNPWRREVQSNALNWQPGAAALLQGPQKTSNAKTTFAAFGPRQGRSTDGMESLKAHAGSAKTGRRGTVGLPRVALLLEKNRSAA